ncbi:hypothetical protein [Pragia fontium]|uniref:hypothetical protein n=1 Tax=Pragia fontium TaxID=82985 RepID=UPI000F6DEDFD|nr:hypothetical protein [Pragia fontium]VEJ54581.1 Uncharacterised protein [Pragia fontium]
MIVDYLLYGAGYSGDLRKFEYSPETIEYIAKDDQQHLKHGKELKYQAVKNVTFKVIKHPHDDGKSYLLAVHEPANLADVGVAIFKFKPSPFED